MTEAPPSPIPPLCRTPSGLLWGGEPKLSKTNGVCRVCGTHHLFLFHYTAMERTPFSSVKPPSPSARKLRP